MWVAQKGYKVLNLDSNDWCKKNYYATSENILHAIWSRICKEYEREHKKNRKTPKQKNKRLNKINIKQNAIRPYYSHLSAGS
jgi:hypothetical protein